MPNTPPLRGASYYDNLPPADHRTGDIWRALPTFDLLSQTTVSGVIITPACDLANRKCETVTYLPIIPVTEFLLSPAFRYECWQEIVPLLNRLSDFGAVIPPSRYELISECDLKVLVESERDANGKLLTPAEINRLASYQSYVEGSSRGTASLEHLKGFIKAERYAGILSKLITNSLKPDIHFLPSDGQPSYSSAVPVHSVVLFRYSLSLPIEALHLAQSTTEGQWSARKEAATSSFPVLRHLRQWPIKMASLKGEFLSDMIARYLNMYIRLGSSDFSDDSIQSMAAEIGIQS
ncbi:hypothetical protein GFM12_13470 [Pseudomonas aeruginosa]|uniref:hypothetical protein n=1 Tax=Pseudomonas aeruginosa TaxID=287 RepID=UPI001909E744|nr:hypothetical protein [Pseudomonas aeruginosa]MBK3753540.1 hypothetical protein [Pseudomonas aeruginosa]MBK3763777.1 hypothetical protein [Pseudomonas aeruginosa]MBK3768075.1 hypothetical protein [Pseudomonas aeruginosa]MBK3790505.1 hypothetical protein [Pseudomonas aeruginosa]MBK3886551.1 hypothetical protein [Pseudomonas aeruginosa]